MRSCEEMELLMNLYLDDMLPSDETRPLKEHLEKCQACREHYQQLCAMKEALSQLEEPVPEGLHGRILDYVKKNGTESAPTVSAEPEIIRPRRWLRTLTTVAACAVVAVVAIRFVPDLEFDAEKDTAEPDILYQSMVESVESAAPPASPTTPETPAVPPAALAPVEQPQPQPNLKQELTNNPAQSQGSVLPVGPLAEDLPPLHKNEHLTEEEQTVRKWIQAEGERENLPDWAAEQIEQLTDVQEVVCDYAVIDYWNEDYWKDQLTPCGFAFSDLEGQNLTEDGEKILIFFAWNE